MPRSRLWWIYLTVGLLAIGGYFALPQGGVEQNIAYDAIGLIEWQPRSPRGGGEPVEDPKKGLLGRLKKSFKR